MTTIYIIILVLSGLALFGYPVNMLANIMGQAGNSIKSLTPFLVFKMKVFIVVTTFYPLIYFLALYKYIFAPEKYQPFWIGFLVFFWIVIIISYGGWNDIHKRNADRSLGKK